MITLQLIQCVLGEVTFRVAEQDSIKFEPFYASNGVTIKSIGGPDAICERLYVRGSEADHDNDEVTCPLTNWHLYQDAVAEFNEQCGIPENPKALQASLDDKDPMEYIPYGPLVEVARVLKHGAEKYGKRNWIDDPIKASTYVGSTARHVLVQWAEGEDIDESGYHHLSHAIAGLLVVMDAKANGTLIDDREKSDGQA